VASKHRDMASAEGFQCYIYRRLDIVEDGVNSILQLSCLCTRSLGWVLTFFVCFCTGFLFNLNVKIESECDSCSCQAGGGTRVTRVM
jgi:hypothetical protein